MSFLSLARVSFQYPSGPVLFEDVSLTINPGDRIAVVGPNGAGKTTLLRLFAGQLKPSQGSIARRCDLKVAGAEQQVVAEPQETLFNFVLRGRALIWELSSRLRRLEGDLSDPLRAAEYAERINEYREAGGFLAEADTARTLGGLGFSARDFAQPVEQLSSGARARAALARALATDAELLTLDEPTNHLDLAAREWLEERLASRAGTYVITSHDRALLCAFAGRVIEIDRAKVCLFEGGYDAYRHERSLLNRQAWEAYEGFQRRKKAMEAASRQRDRLALRVARAPAGIRGSNDHYARKAAKVHRTARILRERVSREQAVQKPWVERPIDGLTFAQVDRSGDPALVATGLTKSYGAKTLFRELSFHLRRGERLAVLGANGCGKTTLLDIIRGSVRPDAGSVRLGANVKLALVAQDLVDLDPALSPLALCGSDTQARILLACLKVRLDCLNRPIGELSAGEQMKVALARALNSGANLLLLDEPTNHLEIEAQEALEQALLQYPGAAIVVSHDRFFLKALGPELAFVKLGTRDESFGESPHL